MPVQKLRWAAYRRRWLWASTALLIVVLGGGLLWSYLQKQQASEAAILFESFQQAVLEQKPAQQKAAKVRLMDRYHDTAFAPRAALIAADLSFAAGNLNSSASDLQWAVRYSKEPPLQDIARLRLAMLCLDLKQYAQGLKWLAEIHNKALLGYAYALKGDLLLKAGQAKAAQVAYQQALVQLDKKDPFKEVVQMKEDVAMGQLR